MTLDDGNNDSFARKNHNNKIMSTSLDTLEDDDDTDLWLTNGDSQLPKTATLAQVASNACKRVHVGCAVMPQPLFVADYEDYDANDVLQDVMTSITNTSGTPYARIVQQEFNAIVIEHHLKWAPLLNLDDDKGLEHNTPATGNANANTNANNKTNDSTDLLGSNDNDNENDNNKTLALQQRLGHYDFATADRMVDWALRHDLTVKGHVLVWAVTSPTAILQQLDAPQVEDYLKRHIFTTMNHFQDRIQLWDVVNEPLAPDGTLADNVFLQKLGPSYIRKAFEWAHQANPNAKLLLNENKVEGVGSPKSEAFYQLLCDLHAQGVPIHGVGLQAHFNAAGTGRNRIPTPRAVKQQIRRLGNLGLTVNFSELDVRVSQLPDGNLRQVAQRQIYHDILCAALSEPAFDGIWTWGFTDRHTWVTHFYYDDEPLLFDEEYNRKDSYYGVRDALASLVPGGHVGVGNNKNAPVPLDSDYHADGKAWGDEWRQPDPVTSPADYQDQPGDARPDWEIGQGGPAVVKTADGAVTTIGMESDDDLKELDSGEEADREIDTEDEEDVPAEDDDDAVSGDELSESKTDHKLPPIS